MMHCIAIDDEKLALDLLVDNIRQVPYLKLAKRCKNSFEATEFLQSQNVDLIFLDVQMPGLSGLQFFKTLIDPPLIILVTAYEEYALEGFDLDVVDYLVKPVSLERFMKACNRAKSLFDLKQTNIKMNHREASDHFFVHVEYQLVKILVRDIACVEGMKDYIKIHITSAPKPVITRMSLKAMMEKLPANHFVRIHKSYIICIHKVSAIKRDFVEIGEQEIPIGESYRENVDRILG